MDYREAVALALSRAFFWDAAPSLCWTDPTTGDRMPRIIGVDKPYLVTPLRIEWDAA